MTRNVSIQTYLPKHVAAWVQDEANRAKQSRSQWIGAIVTDLFQGQELREEARQWPAAGLVDTEIGCFHLSEVHNATKEVQPRVQA